MSTVSFTSCDSSTTLSAQETIASHATTLCNCTQFPEMHITMHHAFQYTNPSSAHGIRRMSPRDNDAFQDSLAHVEPPSSSSIAVNPGAPGHNLFTTQSTSHLTTCHPSLPAISLYDVDACPGGFNSASWSNSVATDSRCALNVGMGHETNVGMHTATSQYNPQPIHSNNDVLPNATVTSNSEQTLPNLMPNQDTLARIPTSFQTSAPLEYNTQSYVLLTPANIFMAPSDIQGSGPVTSTTHIFAYDFGVSDVHNQHIITQNPLAQVHSTVHVFMYGFGHFQNCNSLGLQGICSIADPGLGWSSPTSNTGDGNIEHCWHSFIPPDYSKSVGKELESVSDSFKHIDVKSWACECRKIITGKWTFVGQTGSMPFQMS